MQRVYRQSTRLLGLVIAGLGLALLISTLVRGGGPFALGVVVGIAFVLAGLGRVYLAGPR